MKLTWDDLAKEVRILKQNSRNGQEAKVSVSVLEMYGVTGAFLAYNEQTKAAELIATNPNRLKEFMKLLGANAEACFEVYSDALHITWRPNI